MKSNQQLQTDVQNAIMWEPLLKAAEIGVSVEDGIVTLTGTVDSYVKKVEAEDATKNVAGVKAVVEKIEVKLSSLLNIRDDNEIASEVINAFKCHWEIPSDKIKVNVEDGWVTLEGTLIWNYQKEASQNAVKNLFGVKGVTNRINIKSEIQDAIEKKTIEDALRRNWALDVSKIEVEVSSTTVTLKGAVKSNYQKVEAERIAGKAPGVWYVDNKLVIEYQSVFAG